MTTGRAGTHARLILLLLQAFSHVPPLVIASVCVCITWLPRVLAAALRRRRSGRRLINKYAHQLQVQIDFQGPVVRRPSPDMLR